MRAIASLAIRLKQRRTKMDFKFIMLDDDIGRMDRIADMDIRTSRGRIMDDMASDDAFDIGDIVALVSGGPDMTVISVCESGCYEVAWFDGDAICIECLPGEALDYV